MSEYNLQSKYILSGPQNKCFLQIWSLETHLVSESLSFSCLSKSYLLMTFLHQGDKHGTELEEKCVKSLKADFPNSSSKYFALLRMLLTCSHRSGALSAAQPGILLLRWVREMKQETAAKLPDKSSKNRVRNVFHFTSSNAYQKCLQQSLATNLNVNVKLEMGQRNQELHPLGKHTHLRSTYTSIKTLLLERKHDPLYTFRSN